MGPIDIDGYKVYIKIVKIANYKLNPFGVVHCYVIKVDDLVVPKEVSRKMVVQIESPCTELTIVRTLKKVIDIEKVVFLTKITEPSSSI